MADKRLKAGKRTSSAKPKIGAKRKIAATALDRVFMHDLVLEVEIGVYTHEKGVTQRVRISVDVDVIPTTGRSMTTSAAPSTTTRSLRVPRTLVARGHINLVETLAEDLAMHCLAHPRASAVTVKIEKLDKEPGAVGVEIRRGKGRA